MGLTYTYIRFFRGKQIIYLHIMSFSQIDMTQVIKIFPQVRIYLFYVGNIIVADALETRGAGHQQPWHWLCWTKLIQLKKLVIYTPTHCEQQQSNQYNCGILHHKSNCLHWTSLREYKWGQLKWLFVTLQSGRRHKKPFIFFYPICRK